LSTVYLIRHGQASFGADEYDVLSDRGALQSRTLGTYWARRGVHLDAWYTGPSKRQRDTGHHLAAGAREAGMNYADATQIDELDEFPVFQLLARWLPILVAEHPELRGLERTWARSEEKPRLERAFALLIRRWARGELDSDDLESFAQFRARVRRGLARIMGDEGRERHVAVVTSGGPIAIAMQWALELGDEMTMGVAWVVGNTAINEFRYRDSDNLTLVRFNSIPHLQDDALITYR
jgi:broad specificity phosphatase PhoE